MSDGKQAPQIVRRQISGRHQVGEDLRFLWKKQDMLNARPCFGEHFVETDILGNGTPVGHHLSQRYRDTGRHQLGRQLSHLLRLIMLDRLGRYLEMHIRNRAFEFSKRLAIKAGIQSVTLVFIPNMEMHGSCTSLVAGDGRFDSLGNGHRNLRMICLGPARTVGRNHQARKFCGTQKGHVNIRPTSLREMEGQSD